MSIDLRHRFPPVFDQGRIGSCTANALCGVIGFLCPGFLASRLFLYYNERSSDGTLGRDEGVEVSHAVKSLIRCGACREAEWPYLAARLDVRPHRRCYERANRFTATAIPKYPETLRQALTEDRPFVLGIVVYESFRKAGKSGTIPLPEPEKESCLGGHAVVCVGFTWNDHWIMRNCWGTAWGDAGYFYLPSAYLFDPSLTCSEAYCLEPCEECRSPSGRRSQNRGAAPRRG